MILAVVIIERYFFLFESCLWNLYGVVSAVCFSFMEFTKILQSLQDDNYYKLQITTEKKSDAFLKIVQFYFCMCKILLNTMSVACRHLKMIVLAIVIRLQWLTSYGYVVAICMPHIFVFQTTLTCEAKRQNAMLKRTILDNIIVFGSSPASILTWLESEPRKVTNVSVTFYFQNRFFLLKKMKIDSPAVSAAWLRHSLEIEEWGKSTWVWFGLITRTWYRQL